MAKLSKEVCKECYERMFPGKKWGSLQEEMWNCNQVCCRGSVRELMLVSVNIGEIPGQCPYLLEQMVSQRSDG